MVEKEIEKDLAKGEKYAQMLAGKVSRKVVKQTVSFISILSIVILQS